jgi:hypothetical protein
MFCLQSHKKNPTTKLYRKQIAQMWRVIRSKNKIIKHSDNIINLQKSIISLLEQKGKISNGFHN